MPKYKCQKCGKIVFVNIGEENLIFPIDFRCGGTIRGFAHPSIPNTTHSIQYTTNHCNGQLKEVIDNAK